jgi:hypothetical protein
MSLSFSRSVSRFFISLSASLTVFSAFSRADSKGTFFNAQIQGRFPYSQI